VVGVRRQHADQYIIPVNKMMLESGSNVCEKQNNQ
jgi:hypothetical protein